MRQYRQATLPLVAKQDHLVRKHEAVLRGNTIHHDVSILHDILHSVAFLKKKASWGSIAKPLRRLLPNRTILAGNVRQCGAAILSIVMCPYCIPIWDAFSQVPTNMLPSSRPTCCRHINKNAVIISVSMMPSSRCARNKKLAWFQTCDHVKDLCIPGGIDVLYLQFANPLNVDSRIILK